MPQNNRYNSQKNTQKKLSHPLLTCLMASILAVLSTPVLAFTAESNEPIKIQSDHAELDELKGRSIYTGEVVVTQGTTLLTSDKVIVYTNKEGLIKLEAFGSPAKFTHQQEGEPQPTHAYGKKITYTRASETLTLVDDAKLEQDKNTFRGAVIEYNTVSRVVTAEGGEEKSQRVEIIVHPVKNDTGDKTE
ncbi:lipopolysaccharide transport periplasmic protein LptA [Alkalimarinus alittae]|uniref:Lipopolysaccharide export system protein LptA n=1 Tax=Alkalimarinus alittae TaxID=2961619 RepID=A0ABY6MZE6_9ALTE|nr:lipopolysaccharide transport periplasmic protein LptA [Alkalimarinus alittae]UZE95204.1 lipopolysaccharide transport periplasmic protein LptA [Alkalimarinus alittae]